MSLFVTISCSLYFPAESVQFFFLQKLVCGVDKSPCCSSKIGLVVIAYRYQNGKGVQNEDGFMEFHKVILLLNIRRIPSSLAVVFTL